MIGNLTVQSNSAAQNVIVVRSLHDADLDLTCGGGSASYAGLRLEFGVVSRIRYSCSSNTLDSSGHPCWSGGVAPQYGLYATKLGSPVLDGGGNPILTQNSYCTLRPVIEDVPYGIWLDRCLGMQIREGTVEGCGTTGLTIDGGSSKIIVVGTDFEANRGQDVHCIGSDNNFVGIACGKVFTFGTNGPSAASRNRIIGGQCNSIVFTATTAYNVAETTFNITGAGNLTDSGTYNRTKGCFDAGNAAYYSRPRFGPTVSGSPFSFQNTNGDNMQVSVSGGTVSAIDIQTPVGGFFPSGATSGVFQLAPKDIIRITYSAAPTVNVWGV
ncbi:hypothetical protein SAMN05443248_5807 [Bradyrhizobium erythrophlei]|uniref:Uncharacterized protein n=2 Tax=Bradyrhizobium erythrophlei TaxID=1437360 RepID=A0A1M5V788_9BRAD|nr:hypothetical protein SAMN05443248_5807 [Bradyrhizobium erythrophlei]